jgi:hypothetical protein
MNQKYVTIALGIALVLVPFSPPASSSTRWPPWV